MIPYTITDQTITLYVDGEPFTVDRSTNTYSKLVDVLRNKNLNVMPRTQTQMIKEILDNYGVELETLRAQNAGKITIVGRNVLFNGEPINEVLGDRMLDIQEQGLPLDPWIAFAENLYRNPSEVAREELYLWLEQSDLPITEDGHFLAYKKVSSTFKDLHTGTFDNSPGKVVEMPREQVDPIRDNLCSTGLHFCSKEYLPNFGWSSSDTVVLVKINPADVVSIPSDYSNAKGRTWKYEVLQQVDYKEAKWAPVVAADAGPFSRDPFGNPIGVEYTQDDWEEYYGADAEEDAYDEWNDVWENNRL